MCSCAPVDPFVVVVGVEELDLLVRLWTGEIAGDGRMHEQEKIEGCSSWGRKAEITTELHSEKKKECESGYMCVHQIQVSSEGPPALFI